jgi:putative ABC transport system permease protein
MTPPRVARRLLHALLPALDRDVIVADLDDEFARVIAPRRSRLGARLWYWRQVMTSIPGATRIRARFPWSDITRDTTHGLRLLKRNPAFALAAVLTLTLGIGATSAVFTVANAVLVRPLPYADPDRLVAVMEFDRARDGVSGNVSWPDFLDYQSQNQTLSGVAGYTGGSRTLNVAGATPERLRAVMVTDNFFDVLGVPAALGRTLRRDDMPAGAAPVVILSDAAWRQRFASDPSIVGRAIDLNGRPTTVIGVLPADFEFTLRGRAELWLPVQPSPAQVERKFFHWMDAVGRLKPGVTREQAEADLDRIARGFAAVDARFHANTGARAPMLRERVVGDVRPLILILTAASALVLLVACANIAGLLLARNAVRGAEMSVRTAMGAGRARLFRQMLAENIALAVPGGILGIAAGQWMMQALIAAIPVAQRARLPHIASLGLDWRAVVITAGLTIAASLIFGLVPAWLSARREHLGSMRGVAGPGAREMRVQSSLIALQVALAVVLLAGAGLMARSLIRLLDVSPGFDADRILTVSLAVPATGDTTEAQMNVAHDALIEQLRTLPGVANASSIDILPLTGGGNTGSFTVRGDASRRETTTLLRSAARGYFETMGIDLLAGRGFSQTDTPDAPRVIMINERLASAAFGDTNPIGQRVSFPFVPNRDFEVVGVVGNERFAAIDVEAGPVLYFPYSQGPDNQFNVVLRAEGDPALLAGPARDAIARLHPSAPIVGVRTMEEILGTSEAVFQRRSVLTMIGGFAVAALLLAAIGLYGVLAQLVARRRREIGVRLALGARSSAIAASVVRKVLLAVGGGLAAGLVGSAFLGRALESLLFGVRPFDPVTLASVVVALGLAAAVACFIPIRRAVRVDPMEALRSE